jgi:putative addiction module killer protein
LAHRGHLDRLYRKGYTLPEFDVRQTEQFARWFAKLRDREARARIMVRIRRLTLGSFGDAISVGGGVRVLRIDYGPGYRVYLARRAEQVVVLLADGDARTQTRDVAIARRLAGELEEQ